MQTGCLTKGMITNRFLVWRPTPCRVPPVQEHECIKDPTQRHGDARCHRWAKISVHTQRRRRERSPKGLYHRTLTFVLENCLDPAKKDGGRGTTGNRSAATTSHSAIWWIPFQGTEQKLLFGAQPPGADNAGGLRCLAQPSPTYRDSDRWSSGENSTWETDP